MFKSKFAQDQITHKRLRVGSKKFVQQGRSRFYARSVRLVREHGKMVRTPLAAFFNRPLMDGSIVSLLPGAGKSTQIDSKSTIPLRDVFPTPVNRTMAQRFPYETIRRLIEQPEQVTGCVLAYHDSGTIQPIPLHAVAPKPFDWDAVHIRERELQESEDEVILDRAARKDRMLVSAATYFETVFVPCITRKNPSVILLRQLDSERVTVS